MLKDLTKSCTISYRAALIPKSTPSDIDSSSIQQTAAFELSEEGRLTLGTWHRLIPESNPGISELKWCTNRFVPFLNLDPVADQTPLDRDQEGGRVDVEYMEYRDITLDELNQIILDGHMMLPAVQTCLMAMNWIKKHGL